jgi:hypothetical protein
LPRRVAGSAHLTAAGASTGAALPGAKHIASAHHAHAHGAGHQKRVGRGGLADRALALIRRSRSRFGAGVAGVLLILAVQSDLLKSAASSPAARTAAGSIAARPPLRGARALRLRARL